VVKLLPSPPVNKNFTLPRDLKMNPVVAKPVAMPGNSNATAALIGNAKCIRQFVMNAAVRLWFLFNRVAKNPFIAGNASRLNAA
jgi:hypothetical protein